MSHSNLTQFDLKAALAGGLIREDVMDRIWDISDVPLPFTDMVGEGTASNTFFEWTQDELAAPDLDNARVEGSEVTRDDSRVGNRLGNRIQLADKAVRVSHQADESDTIGRANELAYQVMMRQKELRRDVEAILLSPQASVAGNPHTGPVAGLTAGLPSMINTHVDVGDDDGAAGEFDTNTRNFVAPVAGDARALAWNTIIALLTAIYKDGGNPSVLMSTPDVIVRINQFLLSDAGAPYRAQPVQNISGSGAAVGQIAQGQFTHFVTPLGQTIRLVPNRLQQTYEAGDSEAPPQVADVFLLDPEQIAINYMRKYQVEQLAKLGHSDRRLMSVHFGLRVGNEKALGLVRDIDPTEAVVAGS